METAPPTAPTATALPTTMSAPEPSATVAEELDTLTYWIGHWRAMRLTGTPPDDPLLQEVVTLLLASAETLNLPLSGEELASVAPYDESEALVRNVADAIGAQYGPTAQTTFEIRYATQVADLLLWFVNESMPPEEIQARSHTAANYLSAALNSAQQAGLTGDLLAEGLQLTRDMARGAEPLQASREVFMWRIRALGWLAEKTGATTEPAPTTSGDSAGQSGDAGAGREPRALFFTMGCIDCHYLEEPADGVPLTDLVAPSLAALHEHAAERVAGQDAETYVYTSIVDPNAYVVEGYDADVMPLEYAEEMTEAEIDALVTWLLDPDREQ